MKRVLTFSSASMVDDTFVVLSFTGRESLSTLFSYELEVISQREDIDFDAILAQPAWLGIQQGVAIDSDTSGLKTLKIHGILSHFEQLDQGEGWTRYRTTLVPALWRATLNSRSRVFLGLSVPRIVEQVLADAGFSGSDFDMRLNGRRYPTREYAVQYGESDFDFISRLLEHEGIFYYFVHQESRAKLVLGDGPDAYGRIADPAIFRQTQEDDGRSGSAQWHQHESVHALSCRQAVVPAEVVLEDYNYRTPGHSLSAHGTVADRGSFGSVYSFGDHYKDADEGAAYARVRAEELACRRRTFSGRGDMRAFRAGATFDLREHYRDDFNRGYLLTMVEHSGEQVVDHGSGVVQASRYANRFACISDGVTFRPRRVTSKPRIAGAINAVVDAAGGGDYAELDDQGRYKVRLALDLSDRGEGERSRFVRMAQPYAGEGMGMHFPLHKGAEVLLTHVNGDPDRPIIAGALANPETANVVTARNQTQCVIRSGGRNEVRFEDADGGEELVLHAQRDGVTIVRNDERVTIGHDQSISVDHDRTVTVGHDHSVKTKGKHQESIGASTSATVGGDASRSIAGSESLTVGKDRSQQVAGSVSEDVGAGMSVAVGGDLAESVGGGRSETVAKTRTTTANKVVVDAADEIVLRAGKASLTLRADGTIAIAGGDVRAQGTGNIAISAAKQVALRGAKVTGN
jgi:type VI secretion system secreted protein VgrG